MTTHATPPFSPPLNLLKQQRQQTPAPSLLINHSSQPKPSSITLHAHGRGFGTSSNNISNNDFSNKYKNRPQQEAKAEEEDDEIPQAVFKRMIGRIVAFVGAPMVSGVALLWAQSAAEEQRLVDVPGWVPLLTILLAFGTSAFGVAYGTLSTSWDPEKEGSVLGWEQVEKNWPELWKEGGGKST